MRKKGNWTVVSSEIKYRNPWITVREDAVLRPDGSPGVFGTVTMKPGASVLPLDAEGFVYLVSEYKYAIERDSIEVISGGNDADETFEQTALRELREEAGITAKRLIPLGYIDPFTTAILSPNYLFVAVDLERGQAHPEATEVLQLCKVPFLQAYEWANSGRITHGASVVTILKAKPIYDSIMAEVL